MSNAIIHNKLVRDKIPQIIKDNNKIPITKILSDSEYEIELTKKLQEELDEYKKNHDLEELADLQEVINSILRYKNISKDQFNDIVNNKNVDRGSFRDKVYLEIVETE